MLTLRQTQPSASPAQHHILDDGIPSITGALATVASLCKTSRLESPGLALTTRRIAPGARGGALATTIAIAVANTILFGGLAMAEEKPASPASPGTGQPSTAMPEVQVTGERGYAPESVSLPKYTEPLRNTPQSISVVTRQLMEDQGVTTLRDALRNVSGLSLAAGEGGNQGDSLTIRGFSARSDIFMDGMRDFGSYYRDPFNMQAVEVLNGPSSIAFGRGSTGGVVNQVSKTPTLEKSFSGTTTFGTDGTKRGTIDFNQPLALAGSAMRLNLMVNDGGVAGRDEGTFRRFGIAPSLVFGLGTATRMTLSYYHQSEDNVPDYGIPWLLSKPAEVDRSNYYGFTDGNNFLRTDADIGTFKFEHDVNDNLTLRNQMRYANYFRQAQITEPQVPSSVTSSTALDTIKVTRNQITTKSVEMQFQDQLDALIKFETGRAKHTLVTGMEVAHETSNPTRTTFTKVPTTSLLTPNPDEAFSGTGTVSSQAEGMVDTFALYAMDTVKFGERWEVLGGVRWDNVYSKYTQTVSPASSFNRFDSVVSWRGGVVYKPSPIGSIYFSAGTSFNPSAEQLSLSAANLNVAPEKNTSYEFGTKWDLLDKRLSVTGALFWDEKTDARTTDPNNSTQNILGGNQRATGASIGLVGHLTENLQITTSYTYLDSEVVSSTTSSQVGNPLVNSPQNTFSIWTTYQTPWKLQIGAGADYVSERNASLSADSNTGFIKSVPGYVVFNAMAKYPISKNVDLQLNLNNIADKVYYDGVHPGHIILGAGRTLYATMSFRF